MEKVRICNKLRSHSPIIPAAILSLRIETLFLYLEPRQHFGVTLLAPLQRREVIFFIEEGKMEGKGREVAESNVEIAIAPTKMQWLFPRCFL